jgi:hypothetical protein
MAARPLNQKDFGISESANEGNLTVRRGQLTESTCHSRTNRAIVHEKTGEMFALKAISEHALHRPATSAPEGWS